MYGLVEDEAVLIRILDFIELELLSQHGLRSLSINDQFFRQETDYYRGNIFVWQNYMVLRGLKLYYPHSLKA
jgi:glycogen debranching enzyme